RGARSARARSRPPRGRRARHDGEARAVIARVLPVHSSIDGGRLSVGGCDADELVERFGSPLYVYDEAGLEESCAAFASTLTTEGPAGSRGLYALKAFPTVAMAAIAHRAGLGILCASAGEVAIAAAAGVAPEHRVL